MFDSSRRAMLFTRGNYPIDDFNDAGFKQVRACATRKGHENFALTLVQSILDNNASRVIQVL